MSHVTYHMSRVTNAQSPRPSSADSPIIHSGPVPYPKKAPINHGPKMLLKLSKLLNRIGNFVIILDLESSEPYLTPLFDEERPKKP